MQKYKTLIIVLGIVLASFFSWSYMTRSGFFSMHDDMQFMRLYELDKCFRDGQIPCRWVPDLGYGYGCPLFNYYPPLPYYAGELIHLVLGISFFDTVKILFSLGLILSGIFMYFLAREFFGEIGAILASLFYVYAPYHAVDIYVRGAMTESWAIVFFPLIFWSLYKYAKEEKFSYFIIGVLSLFSLFLSHNIMAMIFTPIAFLWGIYWLIIFKKIKLIWKMFSIFFLALGLGAFFLLPAFLEKSLVKIETLTSDYYNFHYHFATLKQLFWDRSFGYGPSRPGPIDGMSFQLGWPHWWIVLILIILSPFFILRKRDEKFFVLIFFFSFFFLSLFMTHAKSVFIWDSLPLLSFVQFPWRFLGLAMFFSSFLVGFIAILFKGKLKLLVSFGLILLLIFLNHQYFQPEKFYPNESDEEKLSGEEWKIQSMATLMDYLPKQVEEVPQNLAPDSPWVVGGEAKVSEFRKRSNFWRFTIETIGSKPALVSVPVFDFPQWLVLIDQQPVAFSSDNPLGVITVSVPSGKHTVVGWFQNTALRFFANTITILFFSFLTLLVVYVDVKNKNKKIS